MIRPYKGLDILLNSINFLEKDVSEYKILVAGEAYENIDKYKSKFDFKIFTKPFQNEDEALLDL